MPRNQWNKKESFLDKVKDFFSSTESGPKGSQRGFNKNGAEETTSTGLPKFSVILAISLLLVTLMWTVYLSYALAYYKHIYDDGYGVQDYLKGIDKAFNSSYYHLVAAWMSCIVCLCGLWLDGLKKNRDYLRGAGFIAFTVMIQILGQQGILYTSHMLGYDKHDPQNGMIGFICVDDFGSHASFQDRVPCYLLRTHLAWLIMLLILMSLFMLAVFFRRNRLSAVTDSGSLLFWVKGTSAMIVVGQVIRVVGFSSLNKGYSGVPNSEEYVKMLTPADFDPMMVPAMATAALALFAVSTRNRLGPDNTMSVEAYLKLGATSAAFLTMMGVTEMTRLFSNLSILNEATFIDSDGKEAFVCSADKTGVICSSGVEMVVGAIIIEAALAFLAIILSMLSADPTRWPTTPRAERLLTPTDEWKPCPKCATDCPPSAKYCLDCGFSFGGSPQGSGLPTPTTVGNYP
eukprot:GFYU01001274.1.p1 GENE.GFYU01001274.1~~GFYU01001274.1.p1  ORF type:complete len:482 (+),score=107.41 GFYU01001274.1:72-1448(+)